MSGLLAGAAARGWRECFPQLAAAAEPALEALLDGARAVRLEPGHPVFAGGGACQHYLLVLDGDVRVQLIAHSGREVTLYHVRTGDTCVLTTACLLGGDDYPADAVTENAVLALALSKPDFERALDVSPAFRRFVFHGLGQRLADMMRRMDEVTFGDIDARLARGLLARAGDGDTVSGVTHQALAADLGTAREVVSRHLKRFEGRGWVALGRGSIRIADAGALRALARAAAD